MNFNTIEFIVFFAPVTILSFHLAPIALRLPILLVSSLIFYGVSGLIPLVFLVLSILWGYATAYLLRRHPGAPTVVLAISFPLLVLFLFKYLGFTLDSVGAGEGVRDNLYFILSVLLPAGISFYTFQILSYSLDVADGRIEVEPKLLSFATYIALFPQLIAGPIVRYGQMRDQLHRIATEPKLRADFGSGLKYFSIGLFGKIFCADVLAAMLGKFDMSVHSQKSDMLFDIFAYSFQIYYDFWAYSLMAIGLGKMLSLDLPINFNEPYISTSPREFWRRWHMTLSYWLRDYIYIKLGGNKSYVRNILIVFFAVGLWHGAGWNFVVWGLYHAALVVLYHLFRRQWQLMPRVVQIGLTFVLVSLGWPLFKYDLALYAEFMINLVSAPEGAVQAYGLRHWAYLALIAAWTFAAREAWWLYNTKLRTLFDSPYMHATLCSAAVLFLPYRQTFIYFRF